MCRIAVTNAPYYKNGKVLFYRFLDQLERSSGGHGNGVWSSVQNVVLKNAQMSTEFAHGYLQEAANLYPKGNHVLVFHTRIASAGGVRSELNHPFRVSKNAVLVHNGTVSRDKWAHTGASSDTIAVAEAIKRYSIEGVLGSEELDKEGVFIVVERFGKNRTRIHIRHTKSGWPSIKYYTDDKGHFLIASEKPSIASLVASQFDLRDATDELGEYTIITVNKNGKQQLSRLPVIDTSFRFDDMLPIAPVTTDDDDDDGIQLSNEDIELINLEVLSGMSDEDLGWARQQFSSDAEYETWLSFIEAKMPYACDVCPFKDCNLDCSLRKELLGGGSE